MASLLLILISPVVGFAIVAWARSAVLQDRLAHRTGRRIATLACVMVGLLVVTGIIGLL